MTDIHAAEDRCVQLLALVHATRNELATTLETMAATSQCFQALKECIRSQAAELDRVEAERDELKRQLAALRIERGAA